MRAQALTNHSRPGGRPRATRAPRNAFADWLSHCELTPQQIAKALNVSISSVYNCRNSYFVPGRELAVKIEQLTGGKVPIESWSKIKARKRK